MAVEQIQRDIRRIYVTEGDRPYDLPLRAWFNRSALCRESDEQCNISLEFHFFDSRLPSNPMYVLRLFERLVDHKRLEVKVVYGSLVGTHRRATERHLPCAGTSRATAESGENIHAWRKFQNFAL